MKLHELKPNAGSKKRRKRVGRGISAGQGKTAGRGMKGQNARAGGGTSLWHQGGNLPFFRRLPFKRGFTPPHRVEYNEVNLDQLASIPKKVDITPETLASAGLIRDIRKPVVVLGRGEVDNAIKVKVHRITSSAREKIEAAGGQIEIID
jgi:large subunit ribosomal protein L15